jgi:O-antigen ligase
VDVIMGAAAPSPVRRRQAAEAEGPGLPASEEAQALAERPPRHQRFLLGLCAVLAVAAPLCLFLGVRGFAPVVGIAGLLCLPWARPTRQDLGGALILAALVLWAAVTLAWSPAPNLHLPHSLKALSRFTVLHLATQLVFSTALVTAFARLDGLAARQSLGWIAIGFLIAPPLLIEEGLTQARLYQALPALIGRPIRPDWIPANLAQGGYVVAVVAWPLGVALWRGGRPRLALALAAFAPLSMVVLRGVAPTVALAISLPVFFLTLRSGRRAIKALAAVTAAYILLAPMALLAMERAGLFARLQADLAPSWSERLRVWGFVAERWAQKPLRGAGLDASRIFPDVVPLHPHSAPLQLWFELGLPGALLGTLFWLWLWGRIAACAAHNRLHSATAAAAATVYLVIGAVSYGLWQEWWLCVGAFAMALCVLLGRTLAPTGDG